MIRLALNRRNQANSSSGETEESPFLVQGQAPTLSTRFKPARIIGNSLIILGLIMLVGIGGWYGYTQWDNQRQKEEIATKFGKDHVDPTANQASASAPTPLTAPTPLPVLNNWGISVQGSAVLKREDSSPPMRLVIPSVNIDTKVVTVTWNMIPSKSGAMRSEWQVADYAVGHHTGSANPGEIGNVVLSGHVDYKGQVFKELHNVSKGDEVTVYTAEKGQYIYVVTDMVLVKEEGVSEEQKRENARYMDPTPDQTLTMITCWPYGIDDHRLIVIAKPYQSPLSTQADFVIR